jgi:hypothetical protein
MINHVIARHEAIANYASYKLQGGMLSVAGEAIINFVIGYIFNIFIFKKNQ